MKTRKFFQFFLILAILASFSSCRTIRVVEQVPVEVHDTISQKVFLHDSTYIDRWYTVEVKGDTVFLTNNQITVKYRTVTDTTYKYIERPVTVTVEQIKEVKKPLAWWQKGLMWAGAIGILTALAAVVLRIRRSATPR